MKKLILSFFAFKKTRTIAVLKGLPVLLIISVLSACGGSDTSNQALSTSTEEFSSSHNSDPIPQTSLNPIPVNPAPVNPTPVNPAPVNPAPVNPAPVNPAPVNPAPVNPAPASANDWIAEMLGAVNQARSVARSCGNDFMPAVPALKVAPLLNTAAQIHASDNAANDYLSHTGSDGSSAGDRITRTGYNWGSYGENIAAGQTDIASVMRGWLNSPGHCRNIMSPRVTEFGAGYALSPVQTSLYKHYWVQVFARPR